MSVTKSYLILLLDLLSKENKNLLTFSYYMALLSIDDFTKRYSIYDYFLIVYTMKNSTISIDSSSLSLLVNFITINYNN